MDAAVGELVKQILEEVDDRIQGVDKRFLQELSSALEKHAQAASSALRAEREQLSENCDRACAQLSERLTAQIAVIEKRVSSTENVVSDLAASSAIKIQALEERIGKTDTVISGLATGSARLEGDIRTTQDDLKAHLKSAEKSEGMLLQRIAAAETAIEEGSAERTVAKAAVVELREATDRSLSALSERLKSTLEQAELAVKSGGEELARLEKLLCQHMSAARGAIDNVREVQEEVRGHVDRVDSFSKVQLSAREKAEEELKGQLQVLRDQLLNLSMRLSEHDVLRNDVQAMQALFEEHRDEVGRHGSRLQTVEQTVERAVLNGRTTLEDVNARCSRMQLQLVETQTQLREELGVLLEELSKSRIPVDMDRFTSLGRSVSGATYMPSSAPTLANGRSPVDHRGPERYGAADDERSRRRQNNADGEEACGQQ